MLGLTCRVAEGIAGIDVSGTLGLLWLATAADAPALDGGASALGAFFLEMGQTIGPSRPSLPSAARCSPGFSSEAA